MTAELPGCLLAHPLVARAASEAVPSGFPRLLSFFEPALAHPAAVSPLTPDTGPPCHSDLLLPQQHLLQAVHCGMSDLQIRPGSAGPGTAPTPLDLALRLL